MGRRYQRGDEAPECIGPPTCDPAPTHHFGCPLWGPQSDYHNQATKPLKAFLGSRRTPYAKWIKTASLYAWPLWRNWKPPKPVKRDERTPAERECDILRAMKPR